MSSVRCSEGRVLGGAPCALGGTGVFRSSVQMWCFLPVTLPLVRGEEAAFGLKRGGSCCVWRGGGSLPLEWLLLTSLAEQGGRTGGGVLVVPGVWCWEGASLGGVGVRELVGLLLFSHLGFGQAHTGFSCVRGQGGLLGGRSHSRFWVVVGSAWAGSAVSLPNMSMSPLLQPSGSLPSPVLAPLGTVGTLAPLRGLPAPASVLRPPGWEPGSPRGCGAAAGTQVRLRRPLRARGAGRLRCQRPDRSALPTCFCQLKKLLLFSIFHCIYSLLLFLGGSVINLSFLLCLADLKNHFNCC